MKIHPMFYMIALIVVTLGSILFFGLIANSGPTESVFLPLSPLTPDQASRDAFDGITLDPDNSYPDFADRIIINVSDVGISDPTGMITIGENKLIDSSEVKIVEESDNYQASVEVVYYPKGTVKEVVVHVPAGQQNIYINRYDLNSGIK